MITILCKETRAKLKQAYESIMSHEFDKASKILKEIEDNYTNADVDIKN